MDGINFVADTPAVYPPEMLGSQRSHHIFQWKRLQVLLFKTNENENYYINEINY